MIEAERNKVCFKCGESKPLSDFYKHSRMADGHVNKCKECNKVDVRLNRNSKIDYYHEYDRVRGRDRDSERSKKQLEMQPVKRKLFNEKYKARTAVQNAVTSGKITKPCTCQFCGCSDRRIEAHHSSYSEDMYLVVTWLCTVCHGKVHRKYE